MSDHSKPSSAAFDELLAKSRREFDALFGERTAPKRQVSPKVPVEPVVAPIVNLPDDRSITPEVAGQLLARFGSNWRHEIVERKLNGNAVSVTVKLFAEGMDEAPARTATAKIASGGGVISGEANGIAFTSSTSANGQGSDGAATEEAAARAATSAALLECLEAL